MTTEDSVQGMLIEEGFVTKRGPRPLRIWQKRFFRLPAAAQSYPLTRLRLVYRKNAKKLQAPREEFERTNQLLLETLATATVDASRILAYFKSDDKEELPQGFINFNHVTEVEASPKIKPFAFTVKTKSRDYVFSTAAQKDTDAWVASLKRLAFQDTVDCSETAAYKFSYTQLAERKGFASPSVPSQDDEMFSASEGEYEVKEAPPAPQPTEPVVEEVPAVQEPITEDVKEIVPETTEAATETPADAVPDAASPRKSFYTEVIDFFHRKTPEVETKLEAAEPIPEAKEEAKEDTKEEEPKTEFSKEIEEMVAPISSDPPALEPSLVPAAAETPAEVANDAKPTRTKTFNIPKFEGKIFSKLFKKNGSDEETAKDTQQEVVQETTQEPSKEGSKEVSKEVSKETSVVLPATEEAVSTQEAVEETPKEQVEEASTQEPKAETIEEPKEIPSETEAVVLAPEEPSAEVAEAVPETPVTPTKEEKRPFFTRLLSGSRKKEEVEESTIEPVVLAPEATAPVEEAEEKRPFIKRLLSGNLKNKTEATSPVLEAQPEPAADVEVAEPESVVVVDEPVSEVIQEPEATVEVPTNEEETKSAETTEQASEIPTPQRQTSLITRIGELAYSAVIPAAATIPEGAEELSEHYVEKSQDAAHSGFLFKQSTLLHTNNLRYVILSKEGVFTYYRSAQVPSEGKKIQIDSTVQVGPVDELILSIKPANAYAMLFQAKDRQDRDKWGAALAQFAHSATQEEVHQAVAEVLSLDNPVESEGPVPVETTEAPVVAETPAAETPAETESLSVVEPVAATTTEPIASTEPEIDQTTPHVVNTST